MQFAPSRDALQHSEAARGSALCPRSSPPSPLSHLMGLPSGPSRSPEALPESELWEGLVRGGLRCACCGTAAGRGPGGEGRQNSRSASAQLLTAPLHASNAHSSEPWGLNSRENHP